MEAGGSADQSLEREKRRKRRIKALRTLVFRLVSLALILYILLVHIVCFTIMPSNDMYPRLDAGDLLLFYRLGRDYRSQDIVLIDKVMEADASAAYEPGTIRKALNFLGFRDPAGPPTQAFVCRVIGAPGDTVEITGESGLKVNGNAVVETNIFSVTRPYEEYVAYPVTLGPGEYFVLADSRNGGTDSRYFGVVKAEEIRGVLITLLRRNNL